MTQTLAQEAVPAVPNPLGLEGIEFIKRTTPRPQGLGQLLQQVGVRPLARHRSREVRLYRQGRMNAVINVHGCASGASKTPQVAAIALGARDAGAAHRRVVALGARPVPVKVQPKALQIGGVHGMGRSRAYFFDRGREFSIYDVELVPVPTVSAAVPPLAGRLWFGVHGLSLAAPHQTNSGSAGGRVPLTTPPPPTTTLTTPTR